MATPTAPAAREELWPALPLAAWRDTCQTVHMWTQIVGKIRLALAPPVNHWWHVALYVGPRGLTTSAIPYRGRPFEMRFDFLDHNLVIETCEGHILRVGLYPRTVADFYREVLSALHNLNIDVKIWRMPVEVPDPIPFDEDRVHASYDPEYARRFWRVLASSAAVLETFRSGFIGKCSPVHFFWGSFDLAVTRFSGRRAPERPGADSITREAYSHEVISAGFWPGSGEVQDPAFYSYTAPEPAGLAETRVRPDSAFWSSSLREFLLMYDDVRRAPAPEETLLSFLESTYEAGAAAAGWDRESLERKDGQNGNSVRPPQ